jgi:hypothetical protein
MAIITTGAHPKALWPGVHDFFGTSYGEYPREYSEIFETKSSDLAYEEDVATTGFAYAKNKPEGDGFSYDSHHQAYVTRYTHSTWGLGYIVTMEELADNKYAPRSFKRAKMLAFSMSQTKEVNAANILNYGFTTTQPTGFAGGDAVALFSASHPTDAGNQSNIAANAADLSEAAVEDMCIQISLTQNARGLIVPNVPKKLVCHAANAFNAQRILNSPLQNDSPNNAINAMRTMSAIKGGFTVNHFLSAPASWFITTELPDGLTLFQRQELQFEQDNDTDTKNAKAKAWERYVFGWSDWRGAYGNAGV